MVIITPIILILILAFIAFGNGDSSGFEMMGKVILYIALFLGIGWIIVEVPWLLILVVVGIVILAFTSSNNTNSNTTNTNITYEYQDKIYENETVVKPITNPTSFQNELQQNSKTPEEVNYEAVILEKQEIIKQVQSDYKYIKSEIMNKAKSGQYTNCLTGKNIVVDVYSSQLKKYISSRLNKDIIKQGGIGNQSVTYYISNNQMYNYYLSEIRKLADIAGIAICVIFKDNAKHLEFDSLPCNVSNSIVYPRDYSINLRCSINY